MAKKTINVCDICESDSNVQAWEVRRTDGEKAKVDLCGTHGQPLARLFNLDAEDVPPAPRGRGGRRSNNRVMTMEEIAAQTGAGASV